jgi:hypothetical protein
VDLKMHIYWRGGGSTILYGAWGTIKENGASGVLGSKVSVLTE